MTRVPTADGLELEARWTPAAGNPRGVVVFCHPHPLSGGSMRSPLMQSVALYLGREGFHVLRFNFRGVGRSQGSWGGGQAEVADVAAAVAAAVEAHPELPLGIAGWSFGAVTSLRWQAESGSIDRYAGIAPVVERLPGGVPDPTALAPADRLFIIGGRDQYATVGEIERYADAIGAKVAILRGADHFFFFRHDRVAELMAGHLTGRTVGG
jgi:alpha/beta superfamily hydrolase